MYEFMKKNFVIINKEKIFGPGRLNSSITNSN